METSERKFKQGDHVTWTEVKRTGSGISLSTKEGQILNCMGVSEAVVRYRNGKRVIMNQAELRHKNEKTGVTTFVEGLTKAAGTVSQ